VAHIPNKRKKMNKSKKEIHISIREQPLIRLILAEAKRIGERKNPGYVIRTILYKHLGGQSK